MAEETKKTKTEEQKKKTNEETGTTTQKETPTLDISDLSKGKLLGFPKIKEMVEDARSEEKAKLYKTIEDKDKKINKLQEVVDSINKEKENQEQQNKTETELLMDKLESMEETIEELKDENKEIQTQREKDKLEAYKERRIREEKETGNNLITRLVNGTSKEDIDNSISEAINEYNTIKQKTQEEMGVKENEYKKQRKEEKINNTTNVTNPDSDSTSGSLEFTPEDVRNMSMDEYKKNREAIRRMVRTGDIS